MFCFQCQEALNNKGCSSAGVCGKTGAVAELQDALMYAALGLGKAAHITNKISETAELIYKSLFITITNANFDEDFITDYIKKVCEQTRSITKEISEDLPLACRWVAADKAEMIQKGKDNGILIEANEDLRSLKELLIYGLKGVAAYADHAFLLGKRNAELEKGIVESLSYICDGKFTVEGLLGHVTACGNYAVKAMEILHAANTAHYGTQEITTVNTGTKAGKAILISGHDLKDLEELLIQTESKGINIYTHGEMLPANAYPKLKHFKHLAGNFGGAWWKQRDEFDKFPGAILFTTNCIQKPKDSYKDRMFTTGVSAYPGCSHIADRKAGKMKDFSKVIEAAMNSEPLTETKGKTLTIGFGHEQVISIADKVVDAVQTGAIKKFVVMAGCDGRHKERQYYTDVAQNLPQDAVILTAGCAKYRYNQLDLGNIGGIPRVLDAGQCNDSYSLAVIALKLKEVFELDDINMLPIAFDIAWYEQKAVAVLLALLALGFKNIILGPTLPAFLSANVADVLVKNFGISSISEKEKDINKIMR